MRDAGGTQTLRRTQIIARDIELAKLSLLCYINLVYIIYLYIDIDIAKLSKYTVYMFTVHALMYAYICMHRYVHVW